MLAPSNSALLCPCRRKCREAIALCLRQDLRISGAAAGHHPPAANRGGISLLCAWIHRLSPRPLPTHTQAFPVAPRSPPAGLVSLSLPATAAFAECNPRARFDLAPPFAARLDQPWSSPSPGSDSSRGLSPSRPLPAPAASPGPGSAP